MIQYTNDEGASVRVQDVRGGAKLLSLIDKDGYTCGIILEGQQAKDVGQALMPHPEEGDDEAR